MFANLLNISTALLCRKQIIESSSHGTKPTIRINGEIRMYKCVLHVNTSQFFPYHSPRQREGNLQCGSLYIVLFLQRIHTLWATFGSLRTLQQNNDFWWIIWPSKLFSFKIKRRLCKGQPRRCPKAKQRNRKIQFVPLPCVAGFWRFKQKTLVLHIQGSLSVRI